MDADMLASMGDELMQQRATDMRDIKDVYKRQPWDRLMLRRRYGTPWLWDAMRAASSRTGVLQEEIRCV